MSSAGVVFSVGAVSSAGVVSSVGAVLVSAGSSGASVSGVVLPSVPVFSSGAAGCSGSGVVSGVSDGCVGASGASGC